MKCPFCTHDDTRVVDSRLGKEGNNIRRHLSWCVKELVQTHIHELRGRDREADHWQRADLQRLVARPRAAEREVELVLPADVSV